MTLYQSIYDLERDGTSCNIQKRHDVFNDGVVSTYELTFASVTIAKMKEAKVKLDLLRIQEDPSDTELHDDLWSQVKECLDDLERLLPEEVSYNFSGYLDSICLEYLHTFSDWIDRVLSQQQKGD